MVVRYRQMGEGFNRAAFAAAIALLAVSLGVGVGLMRRPAPGPPVRTPDATFVAGTELIEVHVAGWVVAPGVVSVETGSIVADVVEAAGGLRAGARSEAVNLAAEVFAGDQIVISGPESASGPGTDTEGGGLLSLSRADSKALEELPGVGPVLAERIVAFRDEHGRFETVEDLLEVPGIGEAKLASIRDLVRP